MENKQEQQLNQIEEKLSGKIDELSQGMANMRLAEYLDLLERPRKLLYLNFLVGLARGFGMAIGFTLLAAIVVWLLQSLVVLNLPVIGDFIAEMVRMVQANLQ